MTINWAPPENWKIISTIEAHAAGEPLRLIINGFPDIPGKSMVDRSRVAKEMFDDLRRALMWEQRGHADMYGAILTPPVTTDGDIGVLFIHNDGFSSMCGHGIIAITKVILDTGIINKEGEKPVLKVDAPAGRITSIGHRGHDGTVESVSFRNVPSFVYKADQSINVPGIGKVRFDIAFGGAFYDFCDVKEFDLDLNKENCSKLIEIGRKIKETVSNNVPIVHPFENELGFLYGTIIVGPAKGSNNHSRNICIFADGEVDRSPTGTGVSARAAIHFFRNELQLNESINIESIIGTHFSVKAVETLRYGPYPAVVPEVSGKAYITGKCDFYIDPDDPLKEGFIIR